jgi:toxin ParE1/3/4
MTSGFYIAKNSGSIDIANGVIDSITDAFSLFAHAPEAGTKRDEIDSGVRGFPVGNYIIYYREGGSHVLISRVIHGMRDQKSAFNEGEL